MSTTPQTPTALEVPAGSALKDEVSRVLISALDGSDESLRYNRNWIRWGLVEQRIHALIDAAFAAPNETDQQRRAPGNQPQNMKTKRYESTPGNHISTARKQGGAHD